MNKKISLIVVMVLIVGGIWYFSRSNEPIATEEAPGSTGTTGGDSSFTTPPLETSDTSPYQGAVLAHSPAGAILLDFNQADYELVLTENKLVVLYFYANWCPICQAEFPKMQTAFNQLTDNNVVGFRVNYNDNQTDEAETDLAREFGIAYQHTKVILQNGEPVLKSPETWDVTRYLTEVNQLI